MKDWILKIIAKIFLPSKIKEILAVLQSFLKGKKSYLAGSVMILQGIIMTLERFTELQGISDIINWLKQFLSEQGSILIIQGLAVMGIRAAVSKRVAEQNKPE